MDQTWLRLECRRRRLWTPNNSQNKGIISNFSQIFLQGLASCNVLLFFCELLEKLHRPDMVDIAKLCKALIELKKMEWFDPLIGGLYTKVPLEFPSGSGHVVSPMPFLGNRLIPSSDDR